MNKIIVDRDILIQITEAVKNLPVQSGDFQAADQWVSIVIALENTVQHAEPYQEPEKEETAEE